MFKLTVHLASVVNAKEMVKEEFVMNVGTDKSNLIPLDVHFKTLVLGKNKRTFLEILILMCFLCLSSRTCTHSLKFQYAELMFLTFDLRIIVQPKLKKRIEDLSLLNFI